MLFTACFIISLVTLVLALLGAISSMMSRYGQKRLLSPANILFAGTALASVSFFFPIYYLVFEGEGSLSGIAKALMLSLQNAVRLFGLDGDFLDMLELIDAPAAIAPFYTFVGAALYTLAPLLTFNLFLSLIKNMSAFTRYMLSLGKTAHVFTELNEKTLALAKSIRKNERTGFCRRGSVIVFTDVTDEENERYLDLLEGAKRLDAILFKKDVESIRFSRGVFRTQTFFYVAGATENENLRHAQSIIRDYDKDGVTLYLFSDSTRSDILVSSAEKKFIKVIRINDVQRLIYSTLHENGSRLFKNAREHNGSVISAAIVGLDSYGIEMLKALLWFCQMSGFTLKLYAFDPDENATERLTYTFPEIMSKNNENVEGEARYSLTVFSGVDPFSPDFSEKLGQISDLTYAFVSLGSDEKNVSASVQVRSICERLRNDFRPDIETVVLSPEICRAISCEGDALHRGAKNFKGQEYGIRSIGDLDSLYSVDTLFSCPVELAGKEVNARYYENSANADECFYKYEYNYRSSVAKALHEALRSELTELGYVSIPGTDKPWNERTAEEKLAIGRIEHVRWNAYMRTEGYRYAPVRNDLAKTHPNLVPTEMLSDEDLRKDA